MNALANIDLSCLIVLANRFRSAVEELAVEGGALIVQNVELRLAYARCGQEVAHTVYTSWGAGIKANTILDNFGLFADNLTKLELLLTGEPVTKRTIHVVGNMWRIWIIEFALPISINSTNIIIVAMN